MEGFVYLWKNTNNKKMYLGSHLGKVDDGYIGSGIYFKRAYDKTPKDFNRTVLYSGCKFREVEDILLKLVDAASSDVFYNLKNDATGGWSHCQTAEVKAKRGRTLSKVKKGKAPPCASRNKEGSKNPMYGKKHSEVTKRKIAEKRKGVSNRKTPVIEVTTGMHFEKVRIAAEHYGISAATMSALIRNERITRGKCKNKIFKYG